MEVKGVCQISVESRVFSPNSQPRSHGRFSDTESWVGPWKLIHIRERLQFQDQDKSSRFFKRVVQTNVSPVSEMVHYVNLALKLITLTLPDFDVFHSIVPPGGFVNGVVDYAKTSPESEFRFRTVIKNGGA